MDHLAFVCEEDKLTQHWYFTVDPFGNDFFCALCHQELGNTYMHCSGCEDLLRKDFNICAACQSSDMVMTNYQMHPMRWVLFYSDYPWNWNSSHFQLAHLAILNAHKVNAQTLITSQTKNMINEVAYVNKGQSAEDVDWWAAVHANVIKTTHYVFAFMTLRLWRI